MSALTKTPKNANPPKKQILIDVKELYVSYRGRFAIEDLSLKIFKNEHIVLRGGNGAGKSTLLRLLSADQWGDEKNDSSIAWYPKGVADTSALAGKSMVSIVNSAQQEKLLAQGISITGENLIFAGLTNALYTQDKPNLTQRGAIEKLAKWLGAGDLLACDISQLSQGQLRSLLVVRALMRNPLVLLLDEVTDGLDDLSRIKFFEVLEKVAMVSTLVISTHRPDQLPTWVKREIRMQNGQIVADIMLKNKEIKAEEKNTKDTVNIMSSRVGSIKELANVSKKNQQEATQEVQGVDIEIKNADVYVERKPILHSINWSIKPEQHWLVTGDNGSGKSTLLRLLAGDEHPADRGSIHRILPRQGGEVNSLEIIRKGIRIVSDLQQATYGYDVTGEELVLSGLDNSVGVYRTMTDEEIKMAQHSLNLLGVEHLADRSIRACSTGEMRRLLLARAFVGNPDLLLLDEPFSGLDELARDHVQEILQTLVDEGIQIVYVSHHKNDIPKFITHSLSLQQGYMTSKGVLKH